MSRYILTEQAEQDLNDIWDYIADQSVEQADAVVREIRDAFELLAAMPGAGHRRRDVRNDRYRFWRANRFIIAYFRERKTFLAAGVAGVVLTFVAAGIQQARIDVHSTWMTHNALYHVIQGMALLLIFLAARRIVSQTMQGS